MVVERVVAADVDAVRDVDVARAVDVVVEARAGPTRGGRGVRERRVERGVLPVNLASPVSQDQRARKVLPGEVVATTGAADVAVERAGDAAKAVDAVR